MRKYILTAVFLFNILSAQVYAGENAYLYSGDILILDSINDKILTTKKLPSDMKSVYGMKAFPKANAVFIKDEHRVYIQNLITSESPNDSDVSSVYDHINFLLSPNGKAFYVIWLPYENISEWRVGAKRKIFKYDANLERKEINQIDLSDDMGLIDFSSDGTNLYTTISGKPGKILVYDFNSGMIKKEISYNEIGKKTVFNKIAEDIKNSKILFLEIEKRGSGRYAYYVYDIKENKTSSPILSSKRLACNLLPSGDKLICDEFIVSGGITVNAGKLHLFDIRLAAEVRSLDLLAVADSMNKLLGVTPDGVKAYYQTKKGIVVIDVDRFKVIKTLDITGGFMSFGGY